MRRETLFTVAAAVVAGFLGGFIAVRLGAPGAALAARGPQERVLTAERFVLVDSSGNPKAALEVNRDREAGLFLYDGSGRATASFLENSDAIPSLQFYDERGEPLYRVGVRDPRGAGGSAFVIAGKEARFRVLLTPGKKDEKLALELWERGDGRRLWSAP